ncbi:hypothetical protein BN1012_Phect3233 [Candidatus Phaeomarinobacter ectocarpi]|uniref:Uncharacterized protein n=1 Tax=Candidatus Phaeomarinibacter ectocarpi TaxID=1458461 RepID=X5MNN4_9HYPH|nr:hypothetical protein BN1012_Phect3233 [Candidatus Phaeomarinobacter ectocarpi]
MNMPWATGEFANGSVMDSRQLFLGAHFNHLHGHAKKGGK